MINDHTVREGLIKALHELTYIDIQGGDELWIDQHEQGNHDDHPDGCCFVCVVRELTNALNARGAA